MNNCFHANYSGIYEKDWCYFSEFFTFDSFHVVLWYYIVSIMVLQRLQLEKNSINRNSVNEVNINGDINNCIEFQQTTPALIWRPYRNCCFYPYPSIHDIDS